MLPKAAQEEDLQRNLKMLTQRQMCNVFGSFFSHDDQTDANKTNYRRKWTKQFCIAQTVTKLLEEHPFKAHLGKESKNSA